MSVKGKNIAVGVTGGIAAYKTCELVSRLVRAEANVFVVMTKHATQFVAPLTLETLSKNRVVTDMFDRDYEWEVEHISLAKKADIFVVAPATANFAGKFAAGIADDFLTTTVMAAKCPILLAPAMNTNMFTSAAYRANAALLKSRGVRFIEGGQGRLACGDVGSGRMAEPEEIFAEIDAILQVQKDYAGKTVLITAGATQEEIDPVRYITNRSSGKMGVALAAAAEARGAKLILVAGKVDVPLSDTWDVVRVRSTLDMFSAVKSKLSQADIIIKAAAPADYAVVAASKQKIKDETLTLQLKKNPDIAAYVGAHKGDKKLVVFSAETENLEQNARNKLTRKKADLVVANDVTQAGAGFDTDTNIVTLISENKMRQYPLMTKREVADTILDTLLDL